MNRITKTLIFSSVNINIQSKIIADTETKIYIKKNSSIYMKAKHKFMYIILFNSHRYLKKYMLSD